MAAKPKVCTQDFCSRSRLWGQVKEGGGSESWGSFRSWLRVCGAGAGVLVGKGGFKHVGKPKVCTQDLFSRDSGSGRTGRVPGGKWGVCLLERGVKPNTACNQHLYGKGPG